ncbi:MAG: MFS transporter [Stackebrandtia sp.]
MTSTLEYNAPTTAPPGLATKFTVVAAGFMTMLGGATIAPALPSIKSAFADVPNATMLTGMVLSTHALAILLFSPIAGYLGDRFGRKPALIAGLATFAVAGTSGFYLPDLPSILVGRFVLGLGIALIMTSATALIGDLFDEAARQKLLGQQFAATTAGGVIFLLGGGALASLDWRAAFLIYTVGAVMIAPVLAFIPIVRTGAAERSESASDVSATARLGTWLIAPVAAMFAAQALFYILPTQLPGMMQDEFGLGPFAAAMVIAVMSLAMAPSSLAYRHLKRLGSSAMLVAISFVFSAAGFALLALADQVWLVVAGLLVLATGMGFSGPNISNWIVSTAPAAVRGRATGMLTTGLFLGQFLSPIATQPLIDSAGLHATYGFIAAAALAVAAVYWGLGRRTADDRVEPARQ